MARSVKSQSDRSALLFGVGYTARALAGSLKAAGYQVWGTTRSAEKARTLGEKLGISILPFNGQVSDPLADVMRQATVVVSSIGPSDDGSDPVFSALPKSAADMFANIQWAGYLSATSVYGDRGGQWVFEDEKLYPLTQRGRNRIEAELAWIESGLPVHIFRLAGIYGPNLYGQARNAFARLRNGQARAVVKPGHVVNRIHVNDIATAVMASIDRPDPLRVYNLADGNPAPPQDVLNFAADLIGAARPPEIPHTSSKLSDMARSFYKESKRVDNSRARRELGWVPQFSTYQEGLRQIHETM